MIKRIIERGAKKLCFAWVWSMFRIRCYFDPLDPDPGYLPRYRIQPIFSDFFINWLKSISVPFQKQKKFTILWNVWLQEKVKKKKKSFSPPLFSYVWIRNPGWKKSGSGLRIPDPVNCSFLWKKIYTFWSSKPWIRIVILPKMLDPDPYQMNTDPKHWYFASV